MAFQVLLVQSNHEISKTLKQLFSNRGGEVLMAQDHETMLAALSQKNGYSPSLVILDLQMPKNGWLESFRHVSAKFPKAPVLFTTDRSNPDLISQAKAHGAVHFLRAPFTDDGLVHAMRRLSKGSASQASRPQEKRSAPKVRVPMQVKITFPYVFLALIISLTAAFVVSRVAQQSVEERFLSQIVDTGKISADWMVQEEARLLGTLRLVANTEGMAQSLTSNDAERLRALVLPIAINAREEIIEVLNADGLSVLTLQHIPGGNVEEYVSSRGEDAYLGWDFVQNILSGEVDPLGDKYSGIAHTTSGTYFYVGGALFDQDGTPVGIILVGKSALTLVRQIRESTLAHVTLYDVAGQDMASTLFSLEESAFPLPQDEVLNILQNKDGQSTMRSLSSEGTNYREILGVWESRGANDLGVLGVALPETLVNQTSLISGVQIFFLLALAFLLVTAVGLFLSNHITKPLLQIVDASAEIAQGNLDVNVNSKGNDEVAVLAHSFNQMVEGLKEGSLYRDLLGRTVSPQVRDQLRSTLASGDLRLEGQFSIASVLMADVQGFTTLSEQQDPTTILNWLNELFSEIVPIITSYGGVVNEFSGDSLFAFFGILPRPLEGAESALLACRAAVEMLDALERINKHRKHRNDPALKLGIGINTGPVTAGGLGTADRLHYTIIGDTVNTTQRIEGLAHQFDESGIMISKQTLIALWDKREEFNLEAHGVYSVKGKAEKLLVYRLWPAKEEPGLDILRMTR